MMFNTTWETFPSCCTEGDDPDWRKEEDGDIEATRGNLVGGAMTTVPILHSGLPDHLQPVLLQAKVTG